RSKVAYWLERVGLAGRGDDYPRQLSIGQRPRVAVARALLVKPDVLFMDEPFSSLDEPTATRRREELLELWQELGCTVVFVTHNPLEAAFLADRIVVMSPGPGRIVQQLQVTGRLPRPRDGDDPELWGVSREAVRALRGETASKESVGSPVTSLRRLSAVTQRRARFAAAPPSRPQQRFAAAAQAPPHVRAVGQAVGEEQVGREARKRQSQPRPGPRLPRPAAGR